jgi:hypothetical protein
MNTAIGVLIQLGVYFALLFCFGLAWTRVEAKAKMAGDEERAASIKSKQPAKHDSLTTAV